MEHSVRHVEEGVAVLQLTGNLNMASAAALREKVSSLVSEGYCRVIVDLAAVPFLDSSGLGALVGGLKIARGAGGDLRIASPGEQARLVLSLTNTDRVLTPYSTPEEALASA